MLKVRNESVKTIFGSKSIQPRLNLTLFFLWDILRVFPVKYNSTIWLDKGQRPISLPYTVSLINVATSLSFPNKSSFKYVGCTYFGSVINFIHSVLLYKISYFLGSIFIQNHESVSAKFVLRCPCNYSVIIHSEPKWRIQFENYWRKTRPTNFLVHIVKEICSVLSFKFNCQFTKFTNQSWKSYEIAHAYFDEKLIRNDWISEWNYWLWITV